MKGTSTKYRSVKPYQNQEELVLINGHCLLKSRATQTPEDVENICVDLVV